MAAPAMPSDGSPDEPEPLDRETLIVSGVVLLGAVMSILDTTVVNVAIDRLASDFDSKLTTIQWVVTGYTLALATVIPITGWASDRFGSKRIYLASLVLFTLGSVLSGLAWSDKSLIGFRILQGFGGGMIMPTVMTILTHKAGPSRMGRVMGILGVPMLLAPLVGPILGGWLVDSASWRWIFFINLPIGIVAFFSARAILEPDRPQPGNRLDVVGLVLLSPGLALLIYGLAESANVGFDATQSWAPIVVGALLIAAFFAHSWTTEDPLIELRAFTETRAGIAAIAFLLFSVAYFGALLMIPLYYQMVRGDTALQAGLLLAPQGFGAMITMPIAGRLSDRYGAQRFPVLGLPLIVIGISPFAFVSDTTPYEVLAGFGFVLGLGMGLTMMPTITAAMNVVPPAAVARTSTAMNIIRQAGASIGTAILSVILTSQLSDRFGAENAARIQSSPAGEGAPPPRIAAPLADAFASTFVWAVVLLALAFVPALLLALRGSAGAAEPGRDAAPGTARHATPS